MSSAERRYAGATLQERRADQRARLLEAARDVFAENGVAGASIDEIVARAHTSRTSFYRLFDNREDCLLQLYEQLTGKLTQAMLEAAARHDEPEAQLAAGIRALVDTVAVDPAGARVILIEVVGATPRVEQARLRVRETFADILAGELARSDEWSGTPAAELRLIASATMGAVAEILAQVADEAALGNPENITQHLTAYVIRALAPPE